MSLPVFYRLISFADGSPPVLSGNIAKVANLADGVCRVNTFLDSGAFSAWSIGKPIDIQEYISFVQDNQHLLDVYANLDIIGDMRGTMVNQRLMEDAGLRPLPVVHYGTDQGIVREVAHEHSYFAIGGLVGRSQSEILRYCRLVFDTSFSVRSDARIHGFGLTNPILVDQLPLYSADSTTWLLASKFGNLSLYNPVTRSFQLWSRGNPKKFLKNYSIGRELFNFYGIKPVDLMVKRNWRDTGAASAKGWIRFGLDVAESKGNGFRLYLAGGISGIGMSIFDKGVLNYLFTDTHPDNKIDENTYNNRR
jgi:hypothetical protein